VRDRTKLTANVNGTPLTVASDGSFEATVPVAAEGANFVTVAATDQAGNSSSVARQVTRDTRPPELAVTAPAEGLVTRATSIATTGSATDATALTLTLNGAPVARRAGRRWCTWPRTRGATPPAWSAT
jgi:pectin methylesterase-like acyl-CoA thioesterase